MRTIRLIAVVTAVLAGGCTELPTVRHMEQKTFGEGQVALVRFDVQFPAYYSGFGEQTRRVVTNQSEWEAAWRQLWHNVRPIPDAPPVDFDREIVLLAAMGSRGTGGYTIHVEDAAVNGDHVTVRVIETSPGRGCGTTQAVTAPADVVKLTRTPLPIRFETVRSVHDCG